MRKQIIEQVVQKEVAPTQEWLDLEELAQVELTSEAQDYPIDAALATKAGAGWRAGSAGAQVIRLHFERPLSLSCIRLLFEELEQARTQEFVLSWLSEEGQVYQPILRQQYTFAPPGTTRELEEYQVELLAVKGLEVKIIPDISRADAYASLLELRLR
jgi:hypothetical protein